MSKSIAEVPERAQLLARAISRCDTEGGVGEGGRLIPVSDALPTEALPLTNAEIAHLQVRVIALENLLKVLLIDASENQVNLMREVAAFISPHPGFTQHSLTIQAAACMINLVESAAHLRELRQNPSKMDDASP